MATRAQLTYDGYGLVFDRGGKVQAFLDRYQTLENLIVDVERAAYRSRVEDCVGGEHNGPSLPIPNWPPRPRLRLNQLYWPTGATRWALGIFLVDAETVDKLSGGAGSARTFKMYDGVQDAFEAEMYALPPRPITVEVNETEEARLYLLPLVDVRYYWQFQHAESITLDDESDWTLSGDLDIASKFDAIEESDVEDAYGIPDADEMARDYENAAAILDAVAWSTGRRVVRWPDGTIKMESPADAEEQLDANIEELTPWFEIAGGEFTPGPVPAEVWVAFPKLVDHIPVSTKLYKVAKTPTGDAAEIPTVDGTHHTVHSTAWARIDLVADIDSTPANDSFLDALAAQLAEDYYAWRTRVFDRTFQGVKAWQPTGFDDHTLYTFGAEVDPAGEKPDHLVRMVNTRVVSLPSSCAAANNLSQDAENVVLRDMQLVIATEQITRTTAGTCNVVRETSGGYELLKDVNDVQVTVEVRAYALQTAGAVANNTALYVFGNTATGRWQAPGGACGAKDWSIS